MQNIKVSIIIPVFNTEACLRKCIDSCLEQTLNEIEIIIVNDASPDNSHLIMEDYEGKYSDKIKCFYLINNVGLGGARNYGLKMMQGEYFYFLDSDDFIESSLCEKMYMKATESKSDIIFCDHFAEANNKSISKIVDFSEEKMNKIYLTQLMLDASSCGKLFSYNLFNQYQINYPEKIFYEDTATTPVWTMLAKTYDKVNDTLWTYAWCDNSITRSRLSQLDDLQRLDSLDIFFENCKEMNLINIYKVEIELYAIGRILDTIYAIVKKFECMDYTTIIRIQNSIIKHIPKYKSNPLFTNMFFPYERKIIDQIFSGELKSSISTYRFNKKFIHKKSDQIERYLYEHKKYIASMITALRSRGYNNIVIWGMGKIGRALYYAITELGFELTAVDISDKIYNTNLKDGKLIHSSNDIQGKCDVILLTNQNHYDYVKKQFSEVKIIDAMACIKLKVRMEDLWEN